MNSMNLSNSTRTFEKIRMAAVLVASFVRAFQCKREGTFRNETKVVV